jgi:hypothetical protein
VFFGAKFSLVLYALQNANKMVFWGFYSTQSQSLEKRKEKARQILGSN